MAVNVKFAKVHPDAKIPSKRTEDMGFDIYACFDEDYIAIQPHETKLIPTGIASCCSPEYGFVLKERGSTGSKGIALRCGVVDSGYRDQIFVACTNTTNNMLFISKLDELKTLMNFYHCDAIGAMNTKALSTVYPYAKAIAQALVIPVPEIEVEEIPYEDLKAIKSERGLGALGSSGK